MRIARSTSLLAAIALIALAGCGGENGPTAPDAQDSTPTGVLRGEINTDDIAFEFTSASAQDGDVRPSGPFLIRGHNLSYDQEAGVLSADLTVVNASGRTYPEPITLTFAQLLPDGVTIQNADNDESGPGAAFTFGFANDDGVWTPREESFPRTVEFVLAEGASIGFVARIDVGMVPGGGVIGGLVWHDLNEDGLVDADEEGLGGFRIRLEAAPDRHRVTETGPDGAFRFDGLVPGYYTVMRLPRDDAAPTTSPSMQVILVEADGETSSFLAANFGVLLIDEPHDSEIAVGDIVHAKGEYGTAPDRLVASRLCVNSSDDDDDDKDGDHCWARLSGPVTAIDLENRQFAVMGTWLALGDDKRDLDLEDLEIGQRVRADVSIREMPEGLPLIACRLKPFEGDFDRARGVVQDVIQDDDGQIVQIQVLNTTIDVTDAWCDDD